eukprot:CAMPEP_0171891266 /NCGR_PEP_ID=MMETSP0992-20121227/44641_1 /TAXON_ID=483369 /ORGANISM="non described non described, Strain CCMP2098" /LENGTH=78 /DNA_ID=CAMNT_0012518577 /DNA_START=379 /DNA_END=615 /DNA_ORIENTATION=+
MEALVAVDHQGAVEERLRPKRAAGFAGLGIVRAPIMPSGLLCYGTKKLTLLEHGRRELPRGARGSFHRHIHTLGQCPL